MTKFCSQCGAVVTETARFCNKCGERLLATQPAPPSEAPTMTQQPPAPYQQPPSWGTERQMPYQPPYAPPPAAHGELAPNMAGLLCYPLSLITGVIFLALSPYNRNQFVRFHAYQSIFFFAALMVLNIALGILSIVLPGALENLMFAGLRLLGLGGTAWLMYQAYLGNQYKLPVIGDLAENQSLKP